MRFAAGVSAFGLGLLAATSAANQAPGFFWLMNGRMSAEKLCAQLDDMKARGLGSVCWHPMPKEYSPSFPTEMAPGYLTDEYMGLYAKAVDHAAKIGLDFWLYDEGGWPSGSACGLVMKGTGDRYARRYLGIGEDGKPVVTVDCGDPAVQAPYPSLLEPGTTERFLELTHERIKRFCGGHFGRTIKFAFNDESVFPWNRPGKGLGWCTDFDREFRARKGYDLMPYVKDLIEVDRPYAKGIVEPLWEHRYPVTITPELSRVRIDYMDVRSQLFVERYLNPIRDWCRRNGLVSGGHFGGEDQVEGNAYFGYGHILRGLRAFDCPGVDAIWRQIFPGQTHIQYPRYASSAAHQTGNRTVLSETFAVYGDSMTPDEMRWTVGVQMVRGANKFVFSCYAYDDDCDSGGMADPFSGKNPLWDFMPPFFRWVADLSEKLARGRPDAQVAVLFDIRDIWAGGADSVAAADAHVTVSRWLDRHQVDHDFIDDDQIAAAEIRDGRLAVGEMSYAAVVVPVGKWMLPAAKAKLAAFEKAGGKVCRGTAPEGLAPTCPVSGAGAEDIRVMRRRDGGREMLLFFNESMEMREVTLGEYGSRRFAPGECWYWETGMPRAEVETTEVVTAIGGWSPEPGDWRARKGEGFSGAETYRTTFRHAGGRALLDCGKVCWGCRVKLNGRELEPKFFGPFVWEVETAKGENTLEITVANTLANRKANDKNAPKTPFDRHYRKANALNHESGLFGPVTLARRKLADQK